MTSFSRVQIILDNLVENWSKLRERPPNLRRHGVHFGWRTKAELLGSAAFGKPLITPDNIANQTGDSSNLVVALRSGVAPYPRMPDGGPYCRDAEIQEVVDWINSGAPD